MAPIRPGWQAAPSGLARLAPLPLAAVTRQAAPSLVAVEAAEASVTRQAAEAAALGLWPAEVAAIELWAHPQGLEEEQAPQRTWLPKD